MVKMPLEPNLPSQTEKPAHYNYLKAFRTQQCPLFVQHKCTQHRPFTCFNYHFLNQKRRRPVRKKDGTFNYSADVYCTKFDEATGVCSDGDNCSLLHRNTGDTERRYHIRYYKTSTCVYETDSKGFCVKNGQHCAFAHGPHDLRPPVYDIRELQMQEQNEKNNDLANFEKEKQLNEDPKWNDSNYVLANYKTEPCRKPPRMCRQGYACPQFHNNKDKRRSPKNFKYRSTPCPDVKRADEWSDPVQCEKGEKCAYCHTRTEQQFHPEIYKSTKCNDMAQTGYCPRGPFCAFAHVEQEIGVKRDLNDNTLPGSAAAVSNTAGAAPTPTALSSGDHVFNSCAHAAVPGGSMNPAAAAASPSINTSPTRNISLPADSSVPSGTIVSSGGGGTSHPAASLEVGGAVVGGGKRPLYSNVANAAIASGSAGRPPEPGDSSCPPAPGGGGGGLSNKMNSLSVAPTFSSSNISYYSAGAGARNLPSSFLQSPPSAASSSSSILLSQPPPPHSVGGGSSSVSSGGDLTSPLHLSSSFDLQTSGGPSSSRDSLADFFQRQQPGGATVPHGAGAAPGSSAMGLGNFPMPPSLQHPQNLGNGFHSNYYSASSTGSSMEDIKTRARLSYSESISASGGVGGGHSLSPALEPIGTSGGHKVRSNSAASSGYLSDIPNGGGGYPKAPGSGRLAEDSTMKLRSQLQQVDSNPLLSAEEKNRQKQHILAMAQNYGGFGYQGSSAANFSTSSPNNSHSGSIEMLHYQHKQSAAAAAAAAAGSSLFSSFSSGAAGSSGSMFSSSSPSASTMVDDSNRLLSPPSLLPGAAAVFDRMSDIDFNLSPEGIHQQLQQRSGRGAGSAVGADLLDKHDNESLCSSRSAGLSGSMGSFIGGVGSSMSSLQLHSNFLGGGTGGGGGLASSLGSGAEPTLPGSSLSRGNTLTSSSGGGGGLGGTLPVNVVSPNGNNRHHHHQQQQPHPGRDIDSPASPYSTFAMSLPDQPAPLDQHDLGWRKWSVGSADYNNRMMPNRMSTTTASCEGFGSPGQHHQHLQSSSVVGGLSSSVGGPGGIDELMARSAGSPSSTTSSFGGGTSGGPMLPGYDPTKRLREELIQCKNELAQWKEGYSQAKQACEAWQKESHLQKENFKLAQEQEIKAKRIAVELESQLKSGDGSTFLKCLKPTSDLHLLSLSQIQGLRTKLRQDLNSLDQVCQQVLSKSPLASSMEGTSAAPPSGTSTTGGTMSASLDSCFNTPAASSSGGGGGGADRSKSSILLTGASSSAVASSGSSTNLCLKCSMSAAVGSGRPASVVVLPCNHYVLCSECATQQSNCPLCNGAITKRLPVAIQ